MSETIGAGSKLRCSAPWWALDARPGKSQIICRPRREERPQTVFKIIRPDDVVFIPAGTQHSLSNPLELFENYAHGGERFDFVVDEE